MEGLNDKEYNIIVARIMFKTDYKKALKWLNVQGYKMSQSSYFKKLRHIDNNAKSRLYEIAKNFETIAADEIIKFHNLEKQMYDEYYREESALNRARILQMIANLQPYITGLYDQTRQILEGTFEQERDNILSKHPE